MTSLHEKNFFQNEGEIPASSLQLFRRRETTFFGEFRPPPSLSRGKKTLFLLTGRRLLGRPQRERSVSNTLCDASQGRANGELSSTISASGGRLRNCMVTYRLHTTTRVRQSTANGIDTYTGFRQLTGSM